MSNRRVPTAWRDLESHVGSSPSDPQGRTKERRPTELAEPVTQPSAPSAYDGPTLPLGSKAVCPSTERSACLRCAKLAPSTVFGRKTVCGQTAYRAAAKVSTGTESRRHHVDATRPPVRPGRNGPEGGRGVGSHDSQGLAKHHVRMTEPRFEGTPIFLTCKTRPAAPLRSWLPAPRPPGYH